MLFVMSSPAPPSLEKGVPGDQSESDSDEDESVPDTAQPVPVGEKALTGSSPAGGELPPELISPRTDNTQSVGSQHSSEGEGTRLLADPRICRRLKRVEQMEGERKSARLALRQKHHLDPSL